MSVEEPCLFVFRNVNCDMWLSSLECHFPLLAPVLMSAAVVVIVVLLTLVVLWTLCLLQSAKE